MLRLAARRPRYCAPHRNVYNRAQSSLHFCSNLRVSRLATRPLLSASGIQPLTSHLSYNYITRSIHTSSLAWATAARKKTAASKTLVRSQTLEKGAQNTESKVKKKRKSKAETLEESQSAEKEKRKKSSSDSPSQSNIEEKAKENVKENVKEKMKEKEKANEKDKEKEKEKTKEKEIAKVKEMEMEKTVKKDIVVSQPTSIFTDSKTFADFKLSETMLNALKEMNISQPTHIQSLVIPFLMKSTQNVVFSDQTGTGKTLAYLIPIFESLKRDEIEHGIQTQHNRPRALVLVPSRELARQIGTVAKKLAHNVKLRVEAFTGGEKFKPQKEALKEKPIDLIISTPGRLFNHRERDRLFFSQLKHVVIDEADTMFDKDFKEDMDKVIVPIKNKEQRKGAHTQFIIVTATMSGKLLNLIKSEFTDCKSIITPNLHKVRGNLRQEFIPVTNNKHILLLNLIRNAPPNERIMVFCNTIPSCRAMDHFLRENNIKTSCFHGEMPHKLRLESFKEFNSGKTNVMVCTDVASRGIDAVQVDHVVLFDFPLNVIDYLHRIGRTARAAGHGKVTAFIKKGDRVLADNIKRAIQQGQSLEGVTSKLPHKAEKQQSATSR